MQVIHFMLAYIANTNSSVFIIGLCTAGVFVRGYAIGYYSVYFFGVVVNFKVGQRRHERSAPSVLRVLWRGAS